MVLKRTIQSGDLYCLACEMDRGHNFGYKGWHAIGEHLEELSDSIGEDIEIDIIGICCDYSHADNADDFWLQYSGDMCIDPDDWKNASDNEKLEMVREYLQDCTIVVICDDDCIIWQNF